MGNQVDEIKTKNDFTLTELLEAIGGNSGWTEVTYEMEDSDFTRKYYDYPEVTTTTSRYAAKKDDKGNPIIVSVVNHNPDDEDYDEDEAQDNYSDWSYEGGYVYPLGYFRVIDSGNLGDGHEAWALFEHVESGRLFRNGGWYSSWDSGEMDEWDEVEPAEVKVVRYKSKTTDTIYEYPAVTVK